MFDLLVRFQNIDRRWIFLGMGLAIILPMLFPVSLPFAVDERVQQLYDFVEEIPEGSTVFVSADFDPASRPELEPFFRANIHHLFRRNIKIVMATLWPSAPPLVVPIVEDMAKEHPNQDGSLAYSAKTYGKDWCFLGFKDGKELAIKAIGENIPETFPVDFRGNPIESLPMMRGFKQAKDFAMIINVSAGFPGTREYVLQIQGQYDLKIASATTAVSGPDYIPFYKAGQLVGLSAGMPGSAQYEKLVYPDGAPEGTRLLATQAVNVLNVGHLFIIVLIFLGNVAYFLTRQTEGG